MTARSSSKALILALIVSVSFLIPRQTEACGPFFTDAIFVYSKHPDFPLENFAAGKLGVLQPSWARSYLVAAYRNLAGTNFSATEASALKTLWNERLNDLSEIRDDEWIKKWLEARKKVPGIGAPPEIRAFRDREKPHEYQSFLNCQGDAFENAETTLNERIKQFGHSSAQVRDWLSAQDMVFANCGAGREIPEAARPDQDALIRADRAYQIAAANFYSTSFDEAAQQFDSIARDKASPWHDKAAYLAARALLRKGSFAEKAEEARPALTEAEARLNAILKDMSLGARHRATRRLLNLVRLRLRPKEKLHELAHAIIKKDASADFKQDVWDYTVLLDKFLGEDEVTRQQIPTGLTDDELTDWVITIQDASAAASSYSLARWQQTKTLPWLVAAISKTSGQQPNRDALLSAAAQVDHNSPAFATVAFHSVRLLIESKRTDEARTTLDRILANDRDLLSASAVNLLLAQRMILAQNLEEFLQSAQRKPAGFSDSSDGRELPAEESETTETTKGAKLFFAPDSANIFNKAMPAAILKDAARSKVLAANLRTDVTQAAFERAALIDDREAAMQAAALLADVYPELRRFLAAYQKATTPDARRFAAAYLSLKFPGLRPYVSAGVGRATPINEIDSYRDNWWCAEPPVPLFGSQAEGEDGEGKSKPKPITPPEFLKTSQTRASKEFAALQALGTAPNYLCRIAIEWAEKNPNDPRAPEGLHLAVRSTRYGCTDKETGRWSKAAYDLLHRRYPNTIWARNTKYWFKG